MFFRITLSQNLEYEPNPKNYPEGSSFEEMLMLDLENAKEEPELFFHKSSHVIVGKIITEESKAIDSRPPHTRDFSRELGGLLI